MVRKSPPAARAKNWEAGWILPRLTTSSFADPFHTLHCSARDLLAAYALGSIIVVHDCCPTSRRFARPSFQIGGWCGVTYCAFIEFVLSHPDVVYSTVDTDFGCGVIKKDPENENVRAESYAELLNLLTLGKSHNLDTFECFRQHKDRLLKMVSIKAFLALEGIRRSHTAALWWELRNVRQTVAEIVHRYRD